MWTYILIFVGGGLGSLARFATGKCLYAAFAGIHPVATFVANLLASSLLAVLVYVLAGRQLLSADARFFLVTGFCGGFSTFSTFSYETVELIRRGYTLWAVANAALSVGVMVLIVWLIARWCAPLP